MPIDLRISRVCIVSVFVFMWCRDMPVGELRNPLLRSEGRSFVSRVFRTRLAL